MGWCTGVHGGECQRSWRSPCAASPVWCSLEDTCTDQKKATQETLRKHVKNCLSRNPEITITFPAAKQKDFPHKTPQKFRCGWMAHFWGSLPNVKDPGGSVVGDRVLLTATVTRFALWKFATPFISASKGRWPPTCVITYCPLTHCQYTWHLCHFVLPLTTDKTHYWHVSLHIYWHADRIHSSDM